MALHISTSIRTRHSSRRDHVLNLLPPLTVANKEDATIHERLFADKPPQKNYPKNFPSKVLRHLGAWTFYSAPTKGELALLDRSMYDLERETRKTSEKDAVTKQNSGHTGHKIERKTQSHYADDGKEKLETYKGKSLKANKGKQFQPKKKNKFSDKETNVRIEQEKSCLTQNLKKEKCGESNALQKTKQPVSGERDKNIDDEKKIIKRRLKRATSNQQKNVNNQVNTTSLAPIAKAEITLKRARGKVLGGAKTGAEISIEELTVKGHNMPVPGPNPRINSKSDKDVEGTHDAAHRDSIKANTTEIKESKSRKASQSSNLDMYTPVSHDGQKVIIESTDKTALKNKMRSVIKIPLQENESPESSESPEKMSQDAMKHEVSSENLCSKLESDTLHGSNQENNMLCNSNSKSHVLCDTRDTMHTSNPENDLWRDKRLRLV